ncbi:hypothetical protein ACS0PU_010223 [Formica fusca]
MQSHREVTHCFPCKSEELKQVGSFLSTLYGRVPTNVTSVCAYRDRFYLSVKRGSGLLCWGYKTENSAFTS